METRSLLWGGVNAKERVNREGEYGQCTLYTCLKTEQ
jgi:hypothetical protein